MPLTVNVGGTYEPGTVYVNIGGMWNISKGLWVNVGGTWEQFGVTVTMSPPGLSESSPGTPGTGTDISITAVVGGGVPSAYLWSAIGGSLSSTTASSTTLTITPTKLNVPTIATVTLTVTVNGVQYTSSANFSVTYT
jgi:hypothetical protein